MTRELASTKCEEAPPLPREFYLRDTLMVARDLLGMELVRRSADGTTAGIIVETEAYLGDTDPACHAFGGRMTPRTAVMYRAGGLSYVYLIYGMYNCLNITTREEGVPECVLIRALQPTEGQELMRARRRIPGVGKPSALTGGPGRLCQAMGIDRSLYGADMCGDTFFVRRPACPPSCAIDTSPRIGIDYAGEAKHFHWRFYLRGNPCVSPAPRAVPPQG